MSAAGEAFLMGGTAGLMGAGESILGAGIGTGVATGTSMALGNSNVGNFISGVVGGAVGRAAGRASRRTRPQEATEERVPLLGNRLSGRRGRNRLIQQTQQTNDPITGENTTWQIPEQPPPQSTMSILKDVINKKMKNINDGINNLTQQISGRNKTPKKGTYAQLPTDEVLSRFDQDITNDSLTPKIKAASKIKAAVKRTIDQDKYKFNQEWEQLKDDIPLELETYRRAEAQRTLTRALKSKLSRKKMNKLINEKKPTLSSQFNSYPNAMKPNPNDTDSINAMNKHVIDKLQKQLSQKQTLRDELIDVFETDRKQTQAATMLKDTEQQYERLSTQYAKTRAGKIIAPAVKRSSANKHYNQAVGMMEDAQIYNDKLKKLRKTQNKIAFEDFASNIQKQPESVSNFGKLSLGVAKQQRQVNKQIEASERAQSQQKISNFGKLASKAPKLKIIRQDKQTAATATLQNAMRRKTDMMKKRQLVDEAKLKGMEETQRQIEAAKTDTLKKWMLQQHNYKQQQNG